ncbi:uncharacterized protein C05D11.13-like [Littorina saxatilis]|uniref:uncharacterized protein C05D11.13-like n=1 Tax=Littorina saxatilis TaxID=31220 RepID=UPI0038B4F26B
MPPKKSALSAISRDAKRKRLSRRSESLEDTRKRQETNREATAVARQVETLEQRSNRLKRNTQATAVARQVENTEQRSNRLKRNTQATAVARQVENTEQRSNRLERDRQATAVARQVETTEQRSNRLERDRQATAAARQRERDTRNRLALTNDSSSCNSGDRVLLDSFPQPPSYLMNLLTGTDEHSVAFRRDLRAYNNGSQMTSFGCKDGAIPGWNPTFRIQASKCSVTHIVTLIDCDKMAEQEPAGKIEIDIAEEPLWDTAEQRSHGPVEEEVAAVNAASNNTGQSSGTHVESSSPFCGDSFN